MATLFGVRRLAVGLVVAAAALASPAAADAAGALGAEISGSTLAATAVDGSLASVGYVTQCQNRSAVTYRYGQKVVVTKRVCTPVYVPAPRCYTKSYVTYNRYGQKVVTTKRVCY